MTASGAPALSRPRCPWRWGNVPLPEAHLIAIALAVVLERRRPWGLGHWAACQVLGWSLVGAGSSLVVASVASAGRVNLEQPDRLVARGPYALSRNPMYVGWTMLQLGIGLTTGSGWVLAGVPPTVAVVHRRVLREERALEETLGDTFDAYRATVPRYLTAPPWTH